MSVGFNIIMVLSSGSFARLLSTRRGPWPAPPVDPNRQHAIGEIQDSSADRLSAFRSFG
jgi:hypothetical protein